MNESRPRQQCNALASGHTEEQYVLPIRCLEWTQMHPLLSIQDSCAQEATDVGEPPAQTADDVGPPREAMKPDVAPQERLPNGMRSWRRAEFWNTGLGLVRS